MRCIDGTETIFSHAFRFKIEQKDAEQPGQTNTQVEIKGGAKKGSWITLTWKNTIFHTKKRRYLSMMRAKHRAVARDRGLVGKTCVITRRERSTRRYNAPSPSPRGGHRIRKKCS